MYRNTFTSLKLPRTYSGLTGGRRWMGRKAAGKRSRSQIAPPMPLYPFSSPNSASAAACLDAMDDSIETRQMQSQAFASLDVPRTFDRTVGVWFTSNDLRLHDHYPFTMAFRDAAGAAASNSSSSSSSASGSVASQPCPVVGLFCFDIRTFCQPSLHGGFLRMSPLRAQFLVDTVEALRNKMRANGTELFIRVGLPEVEIPKLAKELGCSSVYSSTQYAPHEQWVQDRAREALTFSASDQEAAAAAAAREGKADGLKKKSLLQTVWNSTLVHIDDLISPPQENTGGSSMSERFRLYWDEVENMQIRPTSPYDCADGRLLAMEKHSARRNIEITSSAAFLPEGKMVPALCNPEQLSDSICSLSWAEAAIASSDALLRFGRAAERFTRPTYTPSPSDESRMSHEAASASTVRIVHCGHIPQLDELGYRNHGSQITPVENVGAATFHAGEDYVLDEYIPHWLNTRRGLREYTALGVEHATRIPQLGETAGRLGVWMSHGALSPRKLYEHIREFSYNKMGQQTTEAAARELHMRLARRDFWHFLGVKYGRSFFFPFGPRPQDTADVPDPRVDRAIVQRWCAGLTGIPFVDASMKELCQTGWCNVTSRRAMIWTLARGFGQDWRLGAEWLERNCLDYDPFLCYGGAMYECGILKDRFDNAVRNVKFLANKADASGIYTRRWLPQLSRVPDMYLHRVHVMTKKMQHLHGVVLGKNYPYPVKLWDGALAADGRNGSLPMPLPSYYSEGAEQAATAASSSPDSSNNDAPSSSSSSSDDSPRPISSSINEIHLEARRFSSVNSNIGWAEARKHAQSPLPREQLFPALSRIAIEAGEMVEDGTAAREMREKDIVLRRQREQEEGKEEEEEEAGKHGAQMVFIPASSKSSSSSPYAAAVQTPW